MNKHNLLIINIFFLLIIGCGYVNAGTFYISPSGNDNNPGTLNSPWKTINKANSKLQPGDIVYLRGGTYSQTIRPDKSGSKGKYITYTRYNNETVTITNVSSGADLTNRNYIVIDGLKMVNVAAHWVDMENAKYNIIKNCYLEEAGSYQGLKLRNGADYNKILNNTMIGNCGPDDLIQIRGGSYNLVEGNDLKNGVHNSIGIQYLKDQAGDLPSYYNIIRNNSVRNIYHTGVSNFPDSDHTLIENNVIVDSGEEHQNNSCGSEKDRTAARDIHKGIKAGASYSIIRNNVLVNNGVGIEITRKSGSEWNGGSKNHIYNNTMCENYDGLKSNNPSPSYDNVIKNNIFFNNRDNEIFYNVTANPGESDFFNNNISGAGIDFRPDGKTTINSLESKYSNRWKDNMQANPLFTDEKNRNFKLRSGSPMINAGGFLTKTTNSGSGNTLNVGDAGFFMDGWGIVEGDVIQLQGKTETVKITKINGNSITVDRSISWNKGVGVSLVYSGSSPDLGAYEFNSGKVSNTAPTISKIADQVTEQNKQIGPVSFNVEDKETAAGSLTLSATSSNQSLVKNGDIKFGGNGESRSFTITPQKGQFGTSTISITVSDGSAQSTSGFVLTVKEAETKTSAPTISSIPNQTIEMNQILGPVNFTISDQETAAGSLTLSGTSSNKSLVKDGSIKFGGSGKDRNLTITPETGLSGNTTITITVFDGTDKTTEDFVLSVNKSANENSAPSISEIANQTTTLGKTVGPISFTINDKETSADKLKITFKSSNTSLVQESKITMQGTGVDRKLTITPEEGKTGKSLITLTVSDEKAEASESFELSVTDNLVLSINSLTLVDAVTNKDISGLKDGDIINLADLANSKLSVRANASAETQSVKFNLNNGQINRTENKSPYTLLGDNNGNYTGSYFSAGEYELSVTPYAQSNAGGEKGNSLNIKFKMIDEKENESGNEPVVNSFTLLDAKANKDITTLKDGDIINLADFTHNKFSVRANAGSDVTSVKFDLNNGEKTKTETRLPYTLFGDSNGNYSGQNFNVGEYSLSATPYTQNTKGNSVTIKFKIVDEVASGVNSNVGNNTINSFTLIDAETNMDIAILNDGDIINLATLSSEKLSIRANYEGSIQSVNFNLNDGSHSKTENMIPYAIFGDSKGNYKGKYFESGDYKLSATPYSQNNASGNEGNSLTVRFKIIDDSRTMLVNNISAYPNPFTDMLTIDLGTEPEGQVQVSIFDGYGKIFYEARHNVDTGSTKLVLNLSDVPLSENVMYYLKVKYDNVKPDLVRILRK